LIIAGPYFPAAAADTDAYQFVHVFALYFPPRDALLLSPNAIAHAISVPSVRRTKVSEDDGGGSCVFIINSNKKRSGPNALLIF
jgi:hypothetical protein